MFTMEDFFDYTGTVDTTPARPVRPAAPRPAPKPRPEPIQATKPAPQPKKPALELVNYSDRSFAIFGDTKPLQSQLQTLGGKFNRFLKREGLPTPGYIFSITRIETVRKALYL